MWFAPKIATVLDVLTRPELRRAFGGTLRFLASVVVETIVLHPADRRSCGSATRCSCSACCSAAHRLDRPGARRPHACRGRRRGGSCGRMRCSALRLRSRCSPVRIRAAIPYALLLAGGPALAIPLAVVTACAVARQRARRASASAACRRRPRRRPRSRRWPCLRASTPHDRADHAEAPRSRHSILTFAALNAGARAARSRSIGQRQRARRSAPKRTTSISSCNPATCAASPSRRSIPPISAPSCRTAAAPDFTSCDMSKDPSFKFEKRRLTLYETEEWQLVGLTFPSFWRPDMVPVRVGNRVENRLPPAAIRGRATRSAPKRCWCSIRRRLWRAGRCRRRTCAGAPMARPSWSARSRSKAARLSISARLRSIRRPVPSRLEFARGGEATRAARQARSGAHRARSRRSDRPSITLRPFAALRSMFVTEGNSDVALLGWRARNTRRGAARR